MGRCLNRNHSSFHLYGGQGVSVCRRWRGRCGFTRFLVDMGPRPPGKSLDRFPDRDGDYRPGNCRWATRVQQNNNTARNVFITWRGKRRTVSEWAALTGIGKATISGRRRRRWSVERTLTVKPVRTRGYTTRGG